MFTVGLRCIGNQSRILVVWFATGSGQTSIAEDRAHGCRVQERRLEVLVIHIGGYVLDH